MNNRFTLLTKAMLLISIFILSFQNLALSQSCDNSNPYFVFNYTGPDTIFVGSGTCTAVLQWPMGTPTVGCTLSTPDVCNIIKFDTLSSLNLYDRNSVVRAGVSAQTYYQLDAEVIINGVMTIIRDTFCFEIKIIETEAPIFPTSAPGDVMITCADAIPPPVTLSATDNCDGSFPKTISAVDSGVTDLCGGGVILRTWTATDSSGQSTSMTQRITLEPDTEKPSIGTLPVSATVDCSVADYPAWLATQRATVKGSVSDNCSVKDTLDNAPAMFPMNCGKLDVTFTVSDACGNDSIYTVFYEIIDTELPVLSGITAVNDTINLSCSDAIPAVPTVTATDNCVLNLVPAFAEMSTRGSVMGKCDFYNYQITRTWEVFDSCMNVARDTQILIIKDETAPVFVAPKDTIINCEASSLPANTGNITPLDVSENCDPTPEITFADTVIDTFSMCSSRMLIKRNWTVTDTCGNALTLEQLITVQDTTPPSFTVPADTILSCESATDPSVTGIPRDTMDNCDLTPEMTFNDVRVAGSCTNQFEITRTWTLTDTCGNVFRQNQKITLIDTLPPVISAEARDSVYTCAGGGGVQVAFDDWIMSNGRAVGADNCSGAVMWMAVNSGTSDQATLTAKNCTGTSGSVREQSVDFIIIDACGKSDTTTAKFTEIDNAPPVITVCPNNINRANTPGQCGRNVFFRTPRFTDDCFESVQKITLFEELSLTSDSLFGHPDAIVHPLDFKLQVPNPTASIVGTGITFTVSLNGVDAEIDSSEYFLVYAENGSLLGRTDSTEFQCDTSTTQFTINDLNMLYNWMNNGEIEFRLVPRTPTGLGRESINNICPGGTVSISAEFDANISNDIIFEYSLDGAARQRVDPISNFSEYVEVGSHDMKYYLTDCAGNVDSCEFDVTIFDDEAPSMDCPAPVSADTDAGICTTDLTLELPMNATDNCGLPNGFTGTSPVDDADRFLTFNEDPNLNDFLANDKVITFSGLTGSASGAPAVLTVHFLADMDDSVGFFNVFGEDGSLLGTTREGQSNVVAGDCTTEGTATFLIPEATLNAWAADAAVTITLGSNTNISIPPGGPGSGINPCNTSVVNNGDQDGVSKVWADLSFNQITPTYFASGATDIASTVYTVNHVATHSFNVGTTDVSYVIEDLSGNKDTCTYQITVTDNERPVANCMPTVVRINPSGTVQGTIDPMEIGSGSTDNCEIATLSVTPNTVSCNEIDSTVDVELIVEDMQGNKDTCLTFVRIEGEEPAPSFGYTCGSDTLFLFANPPTSSSTGSSYTYRWTGPSGALISTEENPIITATSLIQAGSYCVEIEGLTGCTSTGCLSIPLDLRPPQPTMSGPSLVCWDTDDITLNSTPPPGFTGAVTYNWYAGSFPNGVLLSTTVTPSFLISAPHALQPDEQQNRCYYVTTTINNCESQPSNVLCMDLVRPPLAVVTDQALTFCEGETLQLFSNNIQNGNLDFSWTGSGLNSTEANPVVTTSVDPDIHTGNYVLTVSVDGCASEPATTIVNILDVPNGTPNLSPLQQNICLGDVFTITTNLTGVTTYHWIPPVGAEIVSSTPSLDLTATMNHDGAWRVYGVVSYANPNFDCSTETSDVAVVNVNTFSANILAIASPSQVCEGEDVHLQVSPVLTNATYEWRNPEGQLVGAAPEVDLINIKKDDEGIYRAIVTNDAGCVKETPVMVTVAEGIEIVAVSNNAPNCFTGATMVKLSTIVSPADVNKDYQYRWDGPPNCGFIGQDSLQVVDLTDFDNCTGIYTLKVTNANGCESNIGSTTISGSAPIPTPIVTTSTNKINHCAGEELILTATTYPTAQSVIYTWYLPTNQTIQTTNDPTYEISGLTTFDAGTYIVTARVDGCESSFSAPITINVNPVPVAFPTSNTVCEGGTLELGGNFFPAGGNTSFTWLTPAGNFALQNPLVINADPDIHNGTYTFIVERDGCESAPGTVNVEINEAPFMPAPMTVDPICLGSGETLNLCVDPNSSVFGATYIWTNVDGDTVGMTNNLCLEITDLSSFSEDMPVAFFVTTMSNGCSAENTTPLIVEFSELPSFVANAGADFTLCDGEAVILDAVVSSDEKGTWRYLGSLPGVNITSPNQTQTEVTGLPAGSAYNFSWSLDNGACEAYSVDSIEVRIFAIETPNAGIDIDTCNTTTFRLRAVPSLSGLGYWEQSAGQAALNVTIIDISDPNTFVTVPGPNPEYFFRWVIPDVVCGGASDLVRVRVASPNTFAGDDFDACGLGNDVLLDANPASSGIGEWTSPNSNIQFTDALEATTTVDNLQDGQNMFIWTTDNGLCGDGSVDTVVVNYSITPIAMNDVVAVPFGGSVGFEPADNDPFAVDFTLAVQTVPRSGVIQNLGNGVLNYTAPLNFIGTDSMTYEICPTDETCVCTQATVYFEVGTEVAECTIPSIFTPNGDGINEFFTIGCLANEEKYPLNELVIFNQWGDEVHRASPYKNDWYGTFKSEELPGGTYFYFLDLRTGDEPMTGFLVIQRQFLRNGKIISNYF